MRAFRSRSGFTLVECTLASALLGFSAVAILEGVILATKFTHENAELLVAEAIAWDAAWKVFNEDFDALQVGKQRHQTLDETSAAMLSRYDSPPKLTVVVLDADEAGFSKATLDLKKIEVNLSWGDSHRRTSLKAKGHMPCVFRGKIGRAVP